MIAQREFILGEEKYVDFQVRSAITQTVIITEASYILSIAGSPDITGDCIIAGNMISVLIEPPICGTFLLEVTYIVGAETRKIRINLKVV